MQLGMLLQRQQLADRYLGRFGREEPVESGILEMEKWSPLTLKLVKSLPYSLTKSQQQAASEIMWDLQQPIPMSRLLQVRCTIKSFKVRKCKPGFFQMNTVITVINNNTYLNVCTLCIQKSCRSV